MSSQKGKMQEKLTPDPQASELLICFQISVESHKEKF